METSLEPTAHSPSQQLTHTDPWLKQPSDDAAMDCAIFVGHYGLPIEGVFEITEMIFLSGGPLAWELWSIHPESHQSVKRIREMQAAGDSQWRTMAKDHGLAAAGISQGTPEAAAAFLFTSLQRAHFPYTSAVGPFIGGLLSSETIGALVDDLHREWDRNRQEAIAEAERNPPPIVLLARELQLNPRPEGHNATAWVANCPSGRGHTIMVSGSSNQFGCGYCRKKGGPEELRAFWLSFHQEGPCSTESKRPAAPFSIPPAAAQPAEPAQALPCEDQSNMGNILPPPSGPWHCSWTQEAQQGDETLILDFWNGRIHGSGFDPDGLFDYHGSYRANQTVNITKVYLSEPPPNQPRFTYTGKWDGQRISGRWEEDGDPKNSGPFAMWPHVGKQ